MYTHLDKEVNHRFVGTLYFADSCYSQCTLPKNAQNGRFGVLKIHKSQIMRAGKPLNATLLVKRREAGIPIAARALNPVHFFLQINVQYVKLCIYYVRSTTYHVV